MLKIPYKPLKREIFSCLLKFFVKKPIIYIIGIVDNILKILNLSISLKKERYLHSIYKKQEVKAMTNELDALSLEYKRYYGTASRNINITDIMNNPNALGVICVFGPGFSEKITDLPFVKISTFADNRPDSPLIL